MLLPSELLVDSNRGAPHHYKLFSILHESLYNFAPCLMFNSLESGIPLSCHWTGKALAFHRRYQVSAKDRSQRLRTKSDFLSLAKTKNRQVFALTTILLLSMSSFAQQPGSTPQPNTQDSEDTVAAANPVPEATIVAV